MNANKKRAGASQSSCDESVISIAKKITSCFSNHPNESLTADREYCSDVLRLFDDFFSKLASIIDNIDDMALNKLCNYCGEKLLFELSKYNLIDGVISTEAKLNLMFLLAKLMILFDKLATLKFVIVWSQLFEKIDNLSPNEDVVHKTYSDFVSFCFEVSSQKSFLNDKRESNVRVMYAVLCSLVSRIDSQDMGREMRFNVKQLSLGRFCPLFLPALIARNIRDFVNDKQYMEMDSVLKLVAIMNYFNRAVGFSLSGSEEGHGGHFIRNIEYSIVFFKLVLKLRDKLGTYESYFKNACISLYNKLVARLMNDLEVVFEQIQFGDKSIKFLNGQLETLKDLLVELHSEKDSTESQLCKNLSGLGQAIWRSLVEFCQAKKPIDDKSKTLFTQIAHFRLDLLDKSVTPNKKKCQEIALNISSQLKTISQFKILDDEIGEFYRMQIISLVLEKTPENCFDEELCAAYSKCWGVLQRVADFDIPIIRKDMNQTILNCSSKKWLKKFVVQIFNWSIVGSFSAVEGYRVVDEVKNLLKMEVLSSFEAVDLVAFMLNQRLNNYDIGSSDSISEWCREMVGKFSRKISCENSKWVLSLMQIVAHFLDGTNQGTKVENLAEEVIPGDVLENVLEVFRSKNKLHSLFNLLSVPVLVLSVNVACIFEFWGLKLHALYFWATISSKAKELCSQKNALLKSDDELEDVSKLLAFSTFFGFCSALNCGSISLCLKFSINLKHFQHSGVEMPFDDFVSLFVDLKVEAFTKQKNVLEVIEKVIAMINLNQTQPWIFFKSSLAVDFLVDLLSETEFSSIDASVLESDASGKPEYMFFAKWKTEVFKYWKSLTRRSCNFDPNSTERAVMPLFFNVKARQPICGLMVPGVAFQSYSQLSHMMKSVGLIDVCKSYDNFVAGENFVSASQSKPIRDMFVAKAFLESFYSYAYVSIFDKSYEMLVKCSNIYLKQEDQVSFEASDVYVKTELGDCKLLKPQTTLSEGLPEIKVMKLVERVNHEKSCLCSSCCNLPMFDNITVVVSLLKALPWSQSEKNKFDCYQGNLTLLYNEKIHHHCSAIEALFFEPGNVQTGEIGIDEEKISSFMGTYHCNGKVPSIEKYTMFSHASTKTAAEAIMECLKKIENSEEDPLR